jgi:predicted P-loop ATPase
MALNVHPFPPQPEPWKLHLINGKGGLPKPLLVNAAHALRAAPAWTGVLAFDDFAKCTMLLSPPPWEMYPNDWQPRVWTGQDDLLTTEWLQQQDISVSLGIAENAIELVAKERLYHPVLEYLDSLEWDGVPRLDLWMLVHLGATNDDYTRAVARCTLIGAIARIRHPGCKVDNVPILEGLQGIGKSSLAEAMFEPWFSDEIADLGSKDAAMQTAGVWMIELGELDAMSRGEVSKIKAFVSRKTDRFRPPYGRRVAAFPRQSVFWGSTNIGGYLKDESGGRRFWPVMCGKLDIAGLRQARDQLWAEADQMYQAGVAWWIVDPKVLKLAEAEQADRYSGDPWDDLVANYVLNLTSVTLHEVLTDAVSVPSERQGQAEQNRIVRILRSMGWEKYRARNSDVLSWRYRKRYPTYSPNEPVEPCENARLVAEEARRFLRAGMDLTEGRYEMN